MTSNIEHIKSKLYDSILDISVANQLADFKESKEGLKRHRYILKHRYLGDGIFISDNIISYETIRSFKECEPCVCISDSVNREFLNVLDNNCETIRWGFFDSFRKRRKESLVNKLVQISSEFDWILVSNKVMKSIIKSSKLIKEVNYCSNSIIKLLGHFKTNDKFIDVYSYDYIEDEKIYFGKYNTIDFILNSDFDINEISTNSLSIDIGYNFLVKDKVKCLTI